MEIADALRQYARDIDTSLHLPRLASRGRYALVEENLRLVVSIARRYAPISSVPLCDLVQEGNLGLIRATRDFDPERAAFSTHATWWIKQAIRQAIYRERTLLTVPDYLMQRLQRLRRLQHDHPDWTETQLAQEMKISVATLRDVDQLSFDVASLNKPVKDGEEDSTLAEMVETQAEEDNPEAHILKASLLLALEQLLGYLTYDERRVISLRYGLEGDDEEGMTQREIAQRLHISEERVRVLEPRALLKMRTYAKMSHLADICDMSA